jgi:hypothetical protein
MRSIATCVAPINCEGDDFGYALGGATECVPKDGLIPLLAWALELFTCALDFGADHASINVVVD